MESEATPLLPSKSTPSTRLEENSRFRDISICNAWPLYALIIILLTTWLPYAAYRYLTYIPDLKSLNSEALPNLSHIYLYSKKYDMYARNQGGAVLLTESMPWAHGSALEVHRYDEHCFQLKSSRNTWLRIDPQTNELAADGLLKMDGAYFAAVLTENSLRSGPRLEGLALKLCGQEVFLQAAQSSHPRITDLGSSNGVQKT
ncbi:hypothetical protein EON65_34805, partial [archaeon]